MDVSTTAAAATAATPERRRGWAAVEVAIAAAVILLDLFLPTLVVLGLAALSLLVRHARPRTLGFSRLDRPGRAAGQILLCVVAWTLFQLAVVMPVVTHLAGQEQDLGVFADLEGDLNLLLALLVLTWTLAALGEEAVYRGYVLQRVIDAAGTGRAAIFAGVVVSSLLFGLAHAEQGVVGVLVTMLDAVFFCWLRFRYRSLWASVLGHGLSNSIGLTVFFVVGPVGALW
jgi:membrane protease YdiL (CAAX protease family)